MNKPRGGGCCHALPASLLCLVTTPTFDGIVAWLLTFRGIATFFFTLIYCSECFHCRWIFDCQIPCWISALCGQAGSVYSVYLQGLQGVMPLTGEDSCPCEPVCCLCLAAAFTPVSCVRFYGATSRITDRLLLFEHACLASSRFPRVLQGAGLCLDCLPAGVGCCEGC